MILKDTAAFQILSIVSLFCAWNVTTVEINSGVHLQSWSCYFVLGLDHKNLVCCTRILKDNKRSPYRFGIGKPMLIVPRFYNIHRRSGAKIVAASGHLYRGQNCI